MDIINYTDFRNKLASILDKVNSDHKPVLITRRNGEPAVLMSLKDFHSYDETAYLMGSPENKKRLDEAVAVIEEGSVEAHESINS